MHRGPQGPVLRSPSRRARDGIAIANFCDCVCLQMCLSFDCGWSLLSQQRPNCRCVNDFFLTGASFGGGKQAQKHREAAAPIANDLVRSPHERATR